MVETGLYGQQEFPVCCVNGLSRSLMSPALIVGRYIQQLNDLGNLKRL